MIATHSLLNSLNPQQRQAVESVEGRVLILAGAGSGKTSVLTARMAYLIAHHEVAPSALLGLTFTNKAAQEMRDRVASLIEPTAARQITLSTFHSFCHKVLRTHIGQLGYTSQFSIYDENDIQRVIKVIVRDILGHEGSLPSIAPTVRAIAAARNKGLKAEEIEGTGSGWHDQFVQQVYQRLQASLRAHNALDFDSLLLLTVELFEKHPDILQRYHERFRYIMIDEYQDTNPVQARLALLLSAKHGNLCVVGDDDQSIYGWRGAEVKNILHFEGATVIKLEQNYRSTNTILQAANNVISNNPGRHAKKLWSAMGEGEPITVFHALNEVEEAESVVFRVAHLKEKLHLRWRDIAILYRSNALSRQFELALMKFFRKEGNGWVRGIPYEVFGGLEFYERREVKDLLAYMRVMANPCDEEAMLRIINQPRRGIGETTLDVLTSYNRSRGIPLWEVLLKVSGGGCSELTPVVKGKALRGIKEFVAILEELAPQFINGGMGEALKALITRIGYEQALEEEVDNPVQLQAKIDNVYELVSALEEHAQNEENPSLSDFLSNNALDNRPMRQQQHGQSEDKVNLMSFHSAKGLEFAACFLVGLEDHIIPHERCREEKSGIEEERRLMYVALTRSKKFLTLSMARRRKRFGQDIDTRPSRFLQEIPKELLRKVAIDQL